MAAVEPHTFQLSQNWTFKQGSRQSNAKYLPANALPTEIHRDLLKNGVIADPFLDMNELSVRWVGEDIWTYKTEFFIRWLPQQDGVRRDLVFHGLDTFATVYLNGEKILESDNMFITHRVDVTTQLKSSSKSPNTLEIVFEPARQRGLELVKQHPEHQFIVHQTEVSRGPVRKAQYHWGWDWGPILLTCGPWKPIQMEEYNSRIQDIWVEYSFGEGLEKVQATVFVRVQGDRHGSVYFELSRPGQTDTILSGMLKLLRKNSDIFHGKVELDEVELWWPRGYGDQNLYTFRAELVSANRTLIHSCSKNIGFRKAELIQEDDQYGTSFFFRINEVDIFSGGSCWIPADSFLTCVSPGDYRKWIELAAEGNQTMIRVWGGGIYESDAFFDACDELGLLVWQDFTFACANYPAYPGYLNSVEEEARQNVRRLRNHPSLIIWTGNNEDYQIVERYGLEYDVEDKDPQSWLKTNFPARYIYEHLLPTIVDEESKGTIYHPSSPFGNGKSTVLKVDPTVGDIHQWNVWHGDMKPYQNLPEMGGRFVSEFGMEAYPQLETIEKSITREEDRYPGSMCMDFQNKAIGHERRLVSYVAENFRIKYDLPSFVHLTQTMQADAITWAYKSWRRQWGTPGKRQCGGILVWQLNDCWPTTSWSVVDYYKVPKPAYYAIKRCLKPVVVDVVRKFHDWTMRPADELWKRDTSHIDLRKQWEEGKFDIWVSSFKRKEVKGGLIVKFFSIRTGEEVRQALELEVAIQPNSTTEVVHEMEIGYPFKQDPNSPFDTFKADPSVIYVSLVVGGQELATDASWPDPIKYLHFPDRNVQVEYSDDKKSVIITTGKPVKAFAFSEVAGIRLSDNGFDVMPGEKKEVTIDGNVGKELLWTYVGK